MNRGLFELVGEDVIKEPIMNFTQPETAPKIGLVAHFNLSLVAHFIFGLSARFNFGLIA